VRRESQKKIAVVVPKYGLVGGGERYVAELTERIAAIPKYDIHVFANQWHRQSDNVTFHKVPVITFPKWLTTISFAYFANRKIARLGVDLIHTHERIFKADICTLHSIPHRIWVEKIRRKKLLSLFDRATIWVEKQMFTKGGCRIFMPVSSFARQKMQEVYTVAPERIRIVHPGVDIEKFKPAESELRLEIRHELGVKDDEVLILFVSMNFELKGLDLLLAALSRLRKDGRGKQPKLLVVGKGNISKYQDISRQLGIAENVVFTGVRHDMERIYVAGDLFVLLSNFDTFGMVVTEAMASGLPVIVSDKVGAKDLVRNAENGFIVDRDNIEEICSKIVHMSDERVRVRMSRNAQKTIKDYTWDKVALDVMNIYENISN